MDPSKKWDWYGVDTTEWYGSVEASHRQIDARTPAEVMLDETPVCAAPHIAFLGCTLTKGHEGQHVAEGTNLVLAVWNTGGKYDATGLSVATRAELAADAPDAFWE